MIKRLIDFVLSFGGVIILFPLFLLVGFLIKIDSRGPVLYKQIRVGKEHRPFHIYKFRSMYLNASNQSRLTVGNDPRVTRIGRYIRRFKIDELPQLFNVLSGDMSLVGPRPEVPEFIEEYPKHIQVKILSVRPGITDLASLEMMDENKILSKYDDPKQGYIKYILPIKQRYYLDYIDNRSLVFDFKIIIMTVCRIIFRN